VRSSNRPRGVNLNHILIFVPNVEEATKFYAEKFGFREVFSFEQAGQIRVRLSANLRTRFLELQPASEEHPPGLGHIGLEVANVEDAVKTLRERGLSPRDPGTSQQTHAHISAVEGTQE